MTLVMKKKVDIYLQHPERFQLDLLNQKSIWMDNVVRPLGSHYESSQKQIESVIKLAEQRKREQMARLKKIELIHSIIMGVLFFGIDVIAAGAMSNVTVLSKKFSAKKDLDHFLKTKPNFEEAFKAFSSQSSSITDAIVADFDNKIKGLVSTGTVTSGISTAKSLAADIKTKVPQTANVKWSGPQKFQNELETFYSTTCRLINETFVNLVRDSKDSAENKKKVLNLLVNLPFVMPPTLSLKPFASFFIDFFELCYWINFVSATSKLKGSFGMAEGYLADVINERILAISGHYFTHVSGVKVGTGGMYLKRGGINLGKLTKGDIRMKWDGWCSLSQVKYANQYMLPDGRKATIESFLIAQGISCKQAYA